MPSKNVTMIGAGFASLAAATVLAKHGHSVTVFEKNELSGGRARVFKVHGFTFDMGPSWYWMPDIFEEYFSYFNKSVSDFYELKKLDPSYRIFFPNNDIDVPASIEELYKLFEMIEQGSSQSLQHFLSDAAYKYKIGMKRLVYKPGQSILEFADIQLLKDFFKLDLFQPFYKYVRKYFKDPRLIMLLEFPILFLGATPQNTPALYSLMNHAGLTLGTWYPVGGMFKIIEGMTTLAESLGVRLETNSEVQKIDVRDGIAKGVWVNNRFHPADTVISGADYYHVEQNLLSPEYRNYDKRYWASRVMAPSSLIFYLGVNKKVENLLHHNLFFDEDYYQHAHEIYQKPQWPKNPLFYVCCPSKTDTTVAPHDCENLFILIPIASGLEDTEELREKYFNIVVERIEQRIGEPIKTHIIFKRSYCIKDFRADYHAFRGNAYGLANTLRQTAILKPSMKSKKIKNLFFTGQLTVPGPGVPPSLISGQVVANEVQNFLEQN